ncbi:autotransporter-associated beta strand repeat-containing protein [Rariglobus hedericola]|uniref:PEP-CTERM sorting domain-containing protein n=1 Tax=Rariglobus hedericola TaxID=2597822 RepID=A0A556QRS0_9BACT|nr:autotransporter-associated beta strand repeat-containing protein [Rariglobus hedericola]TSJ79319.1 PEP-CTERM sorting domain-containing protein [Rariglobus hedericola]
MKTRLSFPPFFALIAATSPFIQAASFTWDPTGAPETPVGGSGDWSTSIANWSNGTADVSWANATGVNTHNAIISASSALSLTTAIRVRNITSAGTTTISGGTLTLDSDANTGTGGGNTGPIIGGAGTLTISSVIAGSRGLGVSTTGTVVISGANTYTGNTLVSNGTLKLGASNTLTTSTSLYIFGSGRTVDLGGFNQTVALIGGSNGYIKNTGGSASTLTINGSGNSTTGIAIQNSINLIKQGTGTLGLSGGQGAINYTGTTTLSDGTLKLTTASSGLTGTSAITIDGGSLASVAAGNLSLGTGHFLMSAGSITPGESGVASSFTLAANRNFTTNGGTLNFDIGTSFDQILGSGTGTFSLTNTTLALSGDVSVAGSYTLFSGFSSGAVSNLTITGLAGGFTGSLANTGILTISAIPEPSTYAAFAGAAMLGLATLRRRSIRR